MTNVLSAEQFMKEYDPLESGGILHVACIDDRPADIGAPYAQIAGGIVGVGQDLAAAIAMKRNREARNGVERGEKLSIAPAQILGALAAGELMPQGIILNAQSSSIAEDYADVVQNNIVTYRAAVFERTQQIRPMTAERFTEVVFGVDSIHVATPRNIASKLESGFTTNWDLQGGHNNPPQHVRGVQRLKPLPMEHLAGEVLVSERERTVFDTAAALAAKTPAYHFGLGVLKQIRESLEGIVDVDEEDLLDASAVRHAAVVSLLEVPDGQTELYIRRVEA